MTTSPIGSVRVESRFLRLRGAFRHSVCPFCRQGAFAVILVRPAAASFEVIENGSHVTGDRRRVAGSRRSAMFRLASPLFGTDR